jgi:hypothetical protein
LIYLGLFGYFRMILVYMVDHWHTTVDQTTLIYSGPALISAPEPACGRLGDPGGRYHDIDRVSCTTRLDLDHRRPDNPDRNTGSRGCPTVLSNAVSAEQQGRVMGNNQALQVGAESLSAAIGGVLAGILIPLPLVAFGILLIGAGLVLAFSAISRPAVSQCEPAVG